MKPLVLLAAIGLAVVASAQGTAPTPRKLPIRHADPWFVKAMLEGTALRSPELGAILALAGGAPPAAAKGVGALFTGGHLIVNPTDNSLWFIPDRS